MKMSELSPSTWAWEILGKKKRIKKLQQTKIFLQKIREWREREDVEE